MLSIKKVTRNIDFVRLRNFSVISGLKCNLEKTCIMFIGPRDPVESPLIEELGFTLLS